MNPRTLWQGNRPPLTPFASADACFVLAFSTVMLNTDQHNPTLKKRMQPADFINNNRTINDGADLPADFQHRVSE